MSETKTKTKPVQSIIEDIDVGNVTEVSVNVDEETGTLGIDFPPGVSNAFIVIMRNVALQDDDKENKIFVKWSTKVLGATSKKELNAILEGFANELTKAKIAEKSSSTSKQISPSRKEELIKSAKEEALKRVSSVSKKTMEKVQKAKKEIKKEEEDIDEAVKIMKSSQSKDIDEGAKREIKQSKIEIAKDRLELQRIFGEAISKVKNELRKTRIPTGAIVQERLVKSAEKPKATKKKKSGETPSQKAKRLEKKVQELKLKLEKCKKK